jgi:hypothetical protein
VPEHSRSFRAPPRMENRSSRPAPSACGLSALASPGRVQGVTVPLATERMHCRGNSDRLSVLRVRVLGTRPKGQAQPALFPAPIRHVTEARGCERRFVVAVATLDRIVPRPTVEVVVAGAAAQKVIAIIDGQPVIPAPPRRVSSPPRP